MTPDVMVDIESLGSAPRGALVSVGACYFGDEIGKTFYQRVQWERDDARITPRTLHWWLRQPNCLDELMGAERYPVVDVLLAFAEFLQGHKRIWAKGPDYDLVMLRSHYVARGVTVPWAFRNSRDVRTMLWLGERRRLSKIERGGVAHNALDDAIFQARQVMAVMEELKV